MMDLTGCTPAEPVSSYICTTIYKLLLSFSPTIFGIITKKKKCFELKTRCQLIVHTSFLIPPTLQIKHRYLCPGTKPDWVSCCPDSFRYIQVREIFFVPAIHISSASFRCERSITQNLNLAAMSMA